MAKLSQIKLGNTTYDIGAAWGNVSGKPSTFPPESHTHSYLPLSGGTLTGTVNSSGNMNLYGSNAYFSLGTSSSSSKCYFQTYNATTAGADDANLKAGFGFGWSNSLVIDKSGNVTIPGDLTVSGGDIVGKASSAKVADAVAWNNITGKPSSFPPAAHNHDSTYLKLSGGTLTGLLNAHGGISLNSSTAQASGAPEYILGIKAFAEGGNVIWQSRANVSVGYADSAGTCTSLSTNAGSATKAIYFSGGKPAQCNDTINHNVSGYSASLAYPTQITTDANIDGFLEANRFKVGTWNSTSSPGVSNGIILSGGWTSTSYGFQIAIDDDPTYFLALRQKNSSGWNAWKQIPMADGTGASGTWNITAVASNHVNNVRTIGSSTMNHAQSLAAEFEANKSTLPRNSLLSYYSSAWGNGSFYQGYFLSGYDTTPYGGFYVCHYDTPYYVGISYGNFNQYQLWKSGDAVTGAVWNDYAECRESDCEEFGYVLMETGDDSLTKTVERLSHFAGISSDTWGFSQGETEKAKTHIAVAGRVLAHPYQDRNNYKPGDCVCAAPGGTVDIMTREEVINWPDRIVGTVSSVPDYEEWGGGNDREAIKVNGRIWIKVR